MRYNVNFNQGLWKQFFPNAKIQHILIFTAIEGIHKSDSQSLKRNEEGYTWISNSLMLGEMPILDIKSKSGASKYIKDLKSWGLIAIQTDKSNKKYYKTTELCEKLTRSPESTGVFTNMNGSQAETRSPESTDHIYYDHNTIDPTVSPNGSTGKNKKVEKFNGKEYHEPTTVKEFKEYCSRSTQEHVRMIGYIAEKSGASYTTSGEWAEYFAAQKKWTAKCVMFSHARIKEALEHAIEKYDEWNAHSIYKALTNQKKKTPKPSYY